MAPRKGGTFTVNRSQDAGRRSRFVAFQNHDLLATTLGQHLFFSGVALTTVQTLLGHRTQAMTLR